MSDLDDFLENQEIGEEVTQHKEAVSRQSFEKASLIAAPFMTEAGALSLRTIRDITIELPCFDPDMAKLRGYSNTEYGIFREGQNSFVRYIETCIAVAKQGPPAVSTKKSSVN
jgi:hypothetical protein